ncbi:(4Fe-4S)-binding protein [Kangiella sp. HZ709]|uniref:(4Fe-4S)-binding protein n=1 Tax=Kangiella sp. HZ709 TaxID=2666328 RepID=UPI0018A1E946|nr:(4Fe-4S)-binding protein [Kangiella sp. HZ709]
MGNEIVKKYSNGDLDIIWKPAKCIHAGECVKRLPSVYNPDQKPWIKPENGAKQDLIEQIEACPSGALSYQLQNAKPSHLLNDKLTNINVIENGPLVIMGNVKISHNGNAEVVDKVSLCRCGYSNNKPYCDGSHIHKEFKG